MRHPFRTILAAIAAALLALALAACGEEEKETPSATQKGPAGTEIKRNPDNARVSLTVGSKNFTEQYVLREIYGQALQAAGYKVNIERSALGSEVVAYKALRQGDVDAYPEYTGTILTAFFKVKTNEVPKDPKAAYDQAKSELAKQKITANPTTPFENTYRLGGTKATIDRLKIKNTSELKGKEKDLTITGYPECRQRQDCLLGVERTYGLKFKKFVASEQTYEVLEQGEADIGFLFTTDAQLATGKFVTLEDDKTFFPPYNVSFLVRDEVMQKLGPDGRKVIEDVQKPLDERAMQELNSRVVLDKEKPEKVAADYLRAEGFVK